MHSYRLRSWEHKASRLIFLVYDKDIHMFLRRGVAQMVERLLCKREGR